LQIELNTGVVKGFYEGFRLRILLSAGKLVLVLFWCAFLLAWNELLAEPFASLLGVVAALILLVNLLSLALSGRKSQSGGNLWLERLQLLLFGAFHSPTPSLETGAASDEIVPVELSEVQAGSGQADQKQTD